MISEINHDFSSHYQKIFDLYKNQNKKDAIQKFDNIFDFYNNLIFNQNEGIILVQLKKFEEALRFLDKALELDHNDIEILLCKGMSLEALGKHQNATKYYTKALQMKSDDWEKLRNIGFSLMLIGKFKDAINYFDAALKINPNDEPAKNGKRLISKPSSKLISTLETSLEQSSTKFNDLVKELEKLQKINVKNQKIIHDLDFYKTDRP